MLLFLITLRRRFWFSCSMALWPPSGGMARRIVWPFYAKAVYRHGKASGEWIKKANPDAAR